VSCQRLSSTRPEGRGGGPEGGAASAVPGVAGPNIKVSGASPFESCTADAGQIGTNFLNSEVEPSVAVSAVDRSGDGVPDRIGAYQQDRWDNGGARGIVASVFHAGAWHQVVIPGVSKCSGGAFDRATDPWVTIAPNGYAYVQTLTFQDFPTFSTSIIYVNKSTDGGLTWGPPVQLVRDDSLFQFNDKNSITADPFDSNFVYAIWDRSRFPSDKREGHFDIRLRPLDPQRRDLHAHDERRCQLGARARHLHAAGQRVRDRAPDLGCPRWAARRTAGGRVHALPRLRLEQEGPGDRRDGLGRPRCDVVRSDHREQVRAGVRQRPRRRHAAPNRRHHSGHRRWAER
jgi:hypothetical protein